MNTTQEIQNDILSPSTPLSTILRKAKVLAFRLKNEEFKKWVEQELNGYPGGFDELPDYRKLATTSVNSRPHVYHPCAGGVYHPWSGDVYHFTSFESAIPK